jgi:hypothetical protein
MPNIVILLGQKFSRGHLNNPDKSAIFAPLFHVFNPLVNEQIH